MPRAESSQLNIRSQFARDRVALISRRTGMTATEVVEDALRAYEPQRDAGGFMGLVRDGPLLVMPSRGKRITLAQANAELEAARTERD